MKANFRHELTAGEVSDIRNFCSSCDYYAIEQSPGFSDILYNVRVTYFYLLDEGSIKSFCQINENMRFAHIWFGPVSNDRELFILSLKEIADFYRKQGYVYLGVQMYLKSGPDCDYVEYKLSQFLRIRYVFDNENTKSSIELDLNDSMESLFRNMRKGHKSDIRKAIREGVGIVEASDSQTVNDFVQVYRRMCSNRSIRGHTAKEIEQIAEYLHTHKQGQLLVARDKDGRVVGGAIFAYQGISVRYLISASDPGSRDLPMTHLIIYRAIEAAREAGFRYFDFWGYNHFAEKNDQIYKVNSFKKGFGGYYTFFAKKMNINLVPGGYNIYRLFFVMKKLWGKFPMRRSLIL
jgi:hypothetical protein